MKITFKENKKMQQLKDVGMGQTFIYNHKLYMKMGEYSKLDYNALLLSHGFLEKLPNNCDVEVVNCELIVSRCERSRYAKSNKQKYRNTNVGTLLSEL